MKTSLFLGTLLIASQVWAGGSQVGNAGVIGIISFFECKSNIAQKLRLFAGADEQEIMNEMANQGQCSMVTDIGYENAAKSLQASENEGRKTLTSVDQLPYGYERNYCDGEDEECMSVEAVNRPGEADSTSLHFNPEQFQTISEIVTGGIAKVYPSKRIYFIANEANRFEDHGNGYDGKWTSIDLSKSVLLIQ